MAGHDINYLAIAGVLGVLGRVNDPPTPPGNLLADFAGGGLMCALGIMLALFDRERSGKGQVVDSAMQDGALYLATFIYNSKLTIWNKPRGTNILDSGAPFYDTYKCKDGQYYSVGAVENHFWAICLKLMELDTIISPDDQYNTNTWDNTRKVISEKFLTKTVAEWQKIFDGSDACAAPVLDMSNILTHPHNVERNVLIRKTDQPSQGNPLITHGPAPAPRLSRTPGISQIKPMPKPGQHTEQILSEYGYTNQDIQEFLNSKIIFCSPSSRL